LQKEVVDSTENFVVDIERANVVLASKNCHEEKNYTESRCKLLVSHIWDKKLIADGLRENCVVKTVNGIELTGFSYHEQLKFLTSSQRPVTIAFTGQNFMKQYPPKKECQSSILLELVSEGDNFVKKAFSDFIQHTAFEKELKSSADQDATIAELLANPQKLLAVIQDVRLSQT